MDLWQAGQGFVDEDVAKGGVDGDDVGKAGDCHVSGETGGKVVGRCATPGHEHAFRGVGAVSLAVAGEGGVGGEGFDQGRQVLGAVDDVGQLAGADDAAGRFGLARERMLLAGFSIGGSMVSYVACADPEAFAAYAPVAGSFWRPHPVACKGPVRQLHTHGWTDLTVPLEGREIFAGFVQGDVFQALQIWRAVNGCTRMLPDAFPGDTPFKMRSWTSCLPGGRLEFALHDGGHSIPKGWATLALDWFEAGE